MWAEMREYIESFNNRAMVPVHYSDMNDLLIDADALLAVVRAAQELVQVWDDKGHGGQKELEAHMKIATTVACLPEHLKAP